MYQLNVRIMLACKAEASEDSTAPMSRHAEFERRLNALLDGKVIRDMLAEAGFDVTQAFVSGMSTRSM